MFNIFNGYEDTDKNMLLTFKDVLVEEVALAKEHYIKK